MAWLGRCVRAMLLGRLLLEWVIARVCVRSLQPLYCRFCPQKTRARLALLGMPSVFKPLALSRTRLMPPARESPGWSPSRAVLAGRDAPARVRARAALRGARQALVEAEVGRLWAESSRAADDARRTAQVGHGAASGAAPPHLYRPRRPRASPTRPRPSGDLSAAPATAPGAVKAHLYRGNPSGRLLE